MITSSNKLQKEFLLGPPRVVGVALSREDLLTARRLLPGSVDALELRQDAFLPEEESAAIKMAGQIGSPLILTLRHFSEGGHAKITNRQRLQRSAAALQLLTEVGYATNAQQGQTTRCVFVDIELRQITRLRKFYSITEKYQAGLIMSYHNFRATPSAGRLLSLAKKACSLRADVVKIACTPQSARDLAAMFSLLAFWRNRTPLALMGMGPLGPESRVLLARLGSILNYGYLRRPSAPGQLEAVKLKRLLSGSEC